MTDVVSCGFARVFLWKSKSLALENLKKGANESLTKFKVRILDERYRLLKENFNNYERMYLDKATFLKVYKIIDERFTNWRSKGEKEKYLENFSKESWNKCADGRKRMHKISKCECCHATTTLSFPVRYGHKNTINSKREPFTQLSVVANENIPKPKDTLCKPLVKEVKQVAEAIYENFNKVCQEKLGRPFHDVMCLASEANLQIKTSPVEKKKNARKVKRQFKKETETLWQENDVDGHLAQRTSFRTRNQQRASQSFESIKEAKQRDNEQRQGEQMKEKSHSPKFITGDLDELLNDFQQWTPGTPINWTAKAREYNIRKKGSTDLPKNAGQLLKAYLKKQGFNTTPY